MDFAQAQAHIAALVALVAAKQGERSGLLEQIDACVRLRLGSGQVPGIELELRPDKPVRIAPVASLELPVDAELFLSPALLKALLSRQASAHVAYLSGQIKVRGDERAALRIGVLLA